MRILLVVTDLDLGGAEAQVVTLAGGLAARGHDVKVASLIDPVARTEQLGAAGVPWFSLGMARGVPDPRALLRLRRLVRAFRPDVVHSHMVHANILSRLTRLTVRMPRLITTAHSSVEGGGLLTLAYRVTDALTDLTTNVSDASVQAFIGRGATPARRIVTVHNGLDLTPFEAAAAARQAMRERLGLDSFTWLAVGRLSAEKDPDNLLRAFRQLPAGSGLLLAGDGPERSALERLAVAGVRFLGRRTDVPELMAAADALVLPSRVEGLPMVLLEAAAARLPVISTDVGGVSEIIEHTRSGLLVPAGDPDALSHAMLKLMHMPAADRERLATNANVFVQDTFGLDHVLDRWEELYAGK